LIGGLGALASVGLSIASKYLAVEVNPLVEKAEAILPGANCGGCGYPGCSGYARAVVDGADISLCSPGGQKVIDALAALLGREVTMKARQVARVHCNGTEENCERRITYQGVQNCRAAVLLTDSTKKCIYSCEGFGDCVAVCKFDAIYMGPGKIPVVIEDACTACGKCVSACPKNLISLEPFDTRTYVACSNPDPGKEVRAVCKVGCISCGLCEKKCPTGAIKLENNIPIWDFKKCDNLGVCAAVCPTGAIHDLRKFIPKAEIDADKCKGHGECEKICPVKKCITGEAGKVHVINAELCCGCAQCVAVCPEKAITMTKDKTGEAAA
jgi:RnfABCDGE-type electron transport complex B subunit